MFTFWKKATRIQNIFTHSVWHCSYICNYSQWTKTAKPHFNQSRVSRVSLPKAALIGNQLGIHSVHWVSLCGSLFPLFCRLINFLVGMLQCSEILGYFGSLFPFLYTIIIIYTHAVMQGQVQIWMEHSHLSLKIWNQ